MYFSLFLVSTSDAGIDSLQEHAGINLRETFDSPLWSIVQSLSAADSINAYLCVEFSPLMNYVHFMNYMNLTGSYENPSREQL